MTKEVLLYMVITYFNGDVCSKVVTDECVVTCGGLEHYYSESCNLIGGKLDHLHWLLAGHVEVTTYRFTYALRGSKPIYSYLHVTCGL